MSSSCPSPPSSPSSSSYSSFSPLFPAAPHPFSYYFCLHLIIIIIIIVRCFLCLLGLFLVLLLFLLFCLFCSTVLHSFLVDALLGFTCFGICYPIIFSWRFFSGWSSVFSQSFVSVLWRTLSCLRFQLSNMFQFLYCLLLLPLTFLGLLAVNVVFDFGGGVSICFSL